MNTKGIARRIDAIERHEAAAFDAFLDSLSRDERRLWFARILERLALCGVIRPAPANLWALPHAEKAAFIAHLREQIPGHAAARGVIRQTWHQWQQDTNV